MNKVILIGNVGKDPESRSLPSGSVCATFSLATTEKWKGSDGNTNEKTEWHSVDFFGKTAELVCQFVKKGSKVMVEGSIKYEKWTDQKGVEKTFTKIKGDKIEFLGGGGVAVGSSSSNEVKKTYKDDAPDEDVPF